ncbi:MAG: hypothetical protein GXY22_08775 [Clostridiaceae bacterium]|jgi:phosphoesterase RecJ-like protein|nr:hypothetical protein [Clostridiaceae bacterium]
MISQTIQQRLEKLAERLERCRQSGQAVCLMPHENIDGDAIGSCLALLLALEQLNIKVFLPLDEPVPSRLDFLPACDRIMPVQQIGRDGNVPEDSLALLIDCSECQRTGKRSELCERFSEHWVIDHHITDRLVSEQEIIDTHAAASAEIVFELIRILEAKYKQTLISHDGAVLLMTALISDTGGFVFSNTSSRSFYMAAELMDHSIQLHDITYRLFRQSTRARIRLMGMIFSDARFFLDNRVVVGVVPAHVMEQLQATDDDLDGIINQLRNVSGVDMALVFREQPDCTIRVNIRSSAAVDASLLARSFGGGGHPRAAGMTLTGQSLSQAEIIVLEKAGEQLSQ